MGSIFPWSPKGKDALVVFGDRLVAERKVYMDFAIPEMNCKRPFYCGVVGKEPIIFTSQENWVYL